MARSYSILRSERRDGRTLRAVVESGLSPFVAADARRNVIQAQEDAAHPGRSSWSKVLFIVELENPNARAS